MSDKIEIQCPKCGETRLVNAQVLCLPTFTGLCLHCWGQENGGCHNREQRMKIAQSMIKHTEINGIGKYTKDLAGYRSMHHSFVVQYGKPNHCEVDPTHTAKNDKFHRAILNGIYTRNIEDYASLCPSCHMAYDANKIKVRGLFKTERMVLNGVTK